MSGKLAHDCRRSYLGRSDIRDLGFATRLSFGRRICEVWLEIMASLSIEVNVLITKTGVWPDIVEDRKWSEGKEE